MHSGLHYFVHTEFHCQDKGSYIYIKEEEEEAAYSFNYCPFALQ